MSLSNMSDQDLADEIGQLSMEVKAREEALERLKDEAKRRGFSVARGLKWIVMASTSETKRLDTKKVKEVLGDALDDSYYNITSVTRITSKPIPDFE